MTNIFAVPSSSPRLAAMEGLRAYAALIVYILHLISRFANERLNIDLDETSFLQLAATQVEYTALYWLWSSHYGVDIFFLLSGYLIAGMVNKVDFHYSRFLFHRFLRIYPTLVIMLFVYVLYGMVFGEGIFWLGGIIGNLLLLNGIPGFDFPGINQVTWSIFFEFSFYFSFPLIWCICKKKPGNLVIISTLIIIPLLLISPDYMRFLMFIAGVILKTLSDTKLCKIRSYFTENQVFLLYIASTTIFVFTKNYMLFIPIYILTATLLVDRAINSQGWLARFFSLKALRYFGNISFSFYLFHPLGLTISHEIIISANVQNNYAYFVLYFIFSLLISLALSILCFSFVEKQYFKNKNNIDAVFDNILNVKETIKNKLARKAC